MGPFAAEDRLMAQSSSASRPQLVAPRAVQQLEAVRRVTGGDFDVDAWHVMEERDNALIADEILHGPGSSTFVYNFEIQGKQVAGISVVGARHLAAHYKGLKHRLVAAMQKTGPLFTFTSYPAENLPMAVSASVVHELEDEADFYAAVCEMVDLKTGNSIQVERREPRFEYRRDGSAYERPNYATIAQSKAYRNAVLALIPQDVAIRWRDEMLKLKKGETITASVLDEKRSTVIRFAAQKALALDRRAVEGLTLDQIAGLGDAAREGRLPAFVEAAKALGLEVAQGGPAEAVAEQGREAAPSASAGAGLAERRPRRRAEPDAAKPAQGEPPATGSGDPAKRRVNFEA
jgi:hypothetical protein